ncbi:nucleoporin complex subunit 54-domain-containing protein [Obelidium mucronatum]|nr:nucleoporin complex subunit 54-domain-containing protein [Obelidium mucronatum]
MAAFGQSTGGGFGGFGATGGLFGQQPQAQTQQTQQQPQSGFGGFGQAQAQQAQPQAGASLFGAAAAAPAAGGGLFGQPQQQQQPQPQQQNSLFGGFGASTQSAQGASLFGQPQQQQQQPQQQQQGFGGFFGQSQQQQQQQQQQQMQMQQRPPATILDKIKELQGYWDPASPMCQFRHYFYNMVHPNEVALYKCPPNHDPTLYQQAVQDNPDPSCMVPVLAIGFEDLKKRINHQEQMSNIHKGKLDELAEWLNTIERKHYLETVVKLEEYKRRHVELSQRVLSMMRTVEVLRNKGYPIRSEEEALRARLEAMSTQLKKPAHFRGRVQELEAALRMVKDARRMDAVGSVGAGLLQGQQPKEGDAGGDGSEMTEDQVGLISQALGTAHQGLRNLTEIVEEDAKDVEVMNRGYTESIYRVESGIRS